MGVTQQGDSYLSVAIVDAITGKPVTAASSATATPFTTAGTTAANTARKGLQVANTSNVIWYGKAGATSGTPSATDCTVAIPATTGYYEMPGSSSVAYRWAPAATVTSGALNVTESV